MFAVFHFQITDIYALAVTQFFQFGDEIQGVVDAVDDAVVVAIVGFIQGTGL